MIGKEYFVQKKAAIILVALLMAIGGVAYFVTGAASKSEAMLANNVNTDTSLFKDIQLKAAFTPEGAVKIFAYARNNNIKNYKSSNGDNIPEYDSMVIGYDEAKMMQEEKLFKKPGDKLKDLFGINTRVGGILDSTGTFADDFHFLSQEQFKQLKGNSEILSVQFKDPNTPKLFYKYDSDNPGALKLELSEGNMNLFIKHNIGKKTYYPIIIGAKEAKMMQEEKLFSKSGDTIEGFFGKDVMIVGIAKQTNTGLDMMHIVDKNFFESKEVTSE